MSWRHRDILEAELHEPKGFTTANNGDSIWRNENGLGEWTDREVLPAALNFVDASVAPPTTASGDIYVLSLGASIHANWGTVALKDWVRYDGTTWNVITPSKSILCYDKTADVLMVYDGSAWTSVSGGGGGGSSIYTADGTLTGDRILNLNGNDLTFNNTSSTIPSLTLENTNTDHTGILINKTGSLVAGEKASIDFNVSGSFSSRIENIYHGSNDMSLTFGTSSNLETFRIRNGKIIANGLGVLGSEGISLQDDVLVKGSNTSFLTSGFKVTDVNNNLILDIKNDKTIGIGGSVNADLALNITGKTNDATKGTLRCNDLAGNKMFSVDNAGNIEAPTTGLINFGGANITPATGLFKLAVRSDLPLVLRKANDSKLASFAHDGSRFTGKVKFGADAFPSATVDIKGDSTASSDLALKVANSSNTSLLEVKNNGVINASNLPTSSAGLSSGDIWNNSGVLNIV